MLALRAVYYYDSEGDRGDPQVGSLQFKSRVVGSLGATVESNFSGHDGSELNEEGEAGVVYSKDPFATGLMATDSASGSKDVGKGKGVEMKLLEYPQETMLSEPDIEVSR